MVQIAQGFLYISSRLLIAYELFSNPDAGSLYLGEGKRFYFVQTFVSAVNNCLLKPHL